MNDKYIDSVQYFVNNHSEFMWQVLLPIFLWLGLLLSFFIFLFVRFTFGKWTTENPNPYQDETFGMPRGTFRGSLTLTLVYIVTVLELVNVRVVGFEMEIRMLMESFQMMIAFYFGSKVMHHVTASDKKKAIAIANSGDYSQDLPADNDDYYHGDNDDGAAG